LNTVIEEVAHTVQFTQVWAGLKRGPILEKVGVNTTGYGAAKRRWASHYVYHAAKSGFSYDNAVEKWAKDRTAEILTSLRTTARARNQWELCGFRLF
jgi:hypothetical protein